MTRLSLALALVLLFPAQSTPAAPWSPTVNGLSCRVALLPDTLLEGAYLKLAVEFDYRPSSSPRSFQLLNRERMDAAYTVHLRNRLTNSRHERRIEVFGPFPGFGSCGEYAFNPLTQSLPPDTFGVRLLNPGGDVVVPGDYDVWVDFTKNGLSDLPDHLRGDYGDAFWSGSLSSVPVTLTVRADPREERRIWTNSRICRGTDGDRCFWTWEFRDSTEIRFKPRPGHGVGRKYDVYRLLESGEREWSSGGFGGPIMDHGGWHRFEGCGSPERFVVTVTVFETAVHQRFSVESSDSTLYRELWTKSFELDPERVGPCAGPWEPAARPRRGR